MCWEVFPCTHELDFTEQILWKNRKCKYLSLCLQALDRFYEAVMQAILRHINFDGRAAA